MDIWTKQLANISNTLAPLISEAKMQSEEVDELLDLYEQAVRLCISSAFVWYAYLSYTQSLLCFLCYLDTDGCDVRCLLLVGGKVKSGVGGRK